MSQHFVCPDPDDEAWRHHQEDEKAKDDAYGRPK